MRCAAKSWVPKAKLSMKPNAEQHPALREPDHRVWVPIEVHVGSPRSKFNIDTLWHAAADTLPEAPAFLAKHRTGAPRSMQNRSELSHWS